MTAPVLALANIQGIALRGFRPRALGFAFLRVVDAAAARLWLAAVAGEVTTAEPWQVRPETTLSLALTARGMAALGVPEAAVASFPGAFYDGMAARAAQLCDTGGNAPAGWEFGLVPDTLHLLMIVAADDAAACNGRLSRLTAGALAAGLVPEWGMTGAALDDDREHFGFVDGIATVAVEGMSKTSTGAATLGRAVRAGAYVLGYPGEYPAPEPLPSPELLGRDGAFFVLRKLRQHVHAMRTVLAAAARPGEDAEGLAAKMMGRWRSGASLALAPERDAPEIARDDEFGYRDDPDGWKCPQGAHVRRVNPRDATDTADVHVPGHLMQRRGMTYGPPLAAGATDDDGIDRGLLFAAVVGSIERQFEFVQREWLLGSRALAGKPPQEGDPIIGGRDVPRVFGFKRAGRSPRRLVGLPDFVTVRGGEYAFLPSIAALHAIAAEDIR